MKENVISKKYSRLTVIAFSHRIKTNDYYICRCDCGDTRVVQIGNLRSGNTKSCGCYSKDFPNAIVHGLKHNPIYSIYSKIMERCYNQKCRSYYLYGGRGIAVSEEWKNNPVAFVEWCTNNGWKKGLQVDRFPDNNGDYGPNNCRIVSRKINCRNRRTSLIIEYNNKKKSLVEWCEELGLKYPRTYYRLAVQKMPISQCFLKQPLIAQTNYLKT